MSTQADLIGIGAVTVMTLGVVFTPVTSESPLRTILTGIFLFTMPGYVTIAVLFPEPGIDGEDVEITRIDSFERIVLSIPLSLIIVAAVGLIASVSFLGFTLESVLIILSLITIIGLIATHLRRQSIGEETAYTPTPELTSLISIFDNRTDTSRSSYQTASIIIAIVLILAVTAGAGYLFTTPGKGETYTELYMLNASDDRYPQNMTVGESERLRIGISNHEQRSMDYTVISELQRVNHTNGQLRITERQRLGEYSISINSNQTWDRDDQLRPQLQGDRLRLIYYLYHDSPPQNPTTETAAQEIYIWVTVGPS